MRTQVLMMMSMTLRGVIVARATAMLGLAAIVVLMLALRHRSRIVIYDLLPKASHGCHP